MRCFVKIKVKPETMKKLESLNERVTIHLNGDDLIALQQGYVVANKYSMSDVAIIYVPEHQERLDL